MICYANLSQALNSMHGFFDFFQELITTLYIGFLGLIFSNVENASPHPSFAFLYRANVDRVYGLCLRMTGERSEAEDCVQEAFIQAWNKLDKFRGDSSFGTWMHRVAVNVVLGRVRHLCSGTGRSGL